MLYYGGLRSTSKGVRKWTEKERRPAMSGKTYKTIETPGGIGEIRKAGTRVAKVFYRLQVRKELLSSNPDTYGEVEIGGEITVSQDEPMQSQVLRSVAAGDLLTLTLSDGRQVNFRVSKTSEFSDAFQIVPENSGVFVTT
jgi:hypothetical protein